MEADQDQEELVHCIYSSTGTIAFSQEELIDLLEKARKNNTALGVTGMLLHEEGSFFQVLEGPPEVVSSLFDQIAADKRHNRVTKIIYEPIEHRDFSEWTMGYSGITRDELKDIDGLNDFFYSKKCYTELDEGRAKTLLEAFTDGKWRSTIK